MKRSVKRSPDKIAAGLSTALDYFVLGLVKDAGLSGYDLAKLFEYVVRFFWSAEQSQVYRALYRLRDLGWVRASVVEQTNAPDKTVYKCTRAGKSALLTWLREDADEPPARRVWLGQFFFANELPARDVIAMLDRRILDLEECLAEFELRVNGPDFESHLREQLKRTGRLPTPGLTLQYAIETVRFEAALLKRMAKRLPELERLLPATKIPPTKKT
ncbi:MAG TPA: PadR family transcriptional regulator [Candidatus Eremiobacteraceae bacterium]|nr:PadR family transcriptional regulator [Candidatus Eremiobacteraceae bacterium]